jgi:diguanylate cyclase (GGDEF)-like protein
MSRATLPSIPNMPAIPYERERNHVANLLEEANRVVTADPAQALALAREAHTHAAPLDDAVLLTQCVRSEGIARLWMADFPAAITLLTDAYQRSCAAHDKDGEASTRNALGVVYTKIGDPAAAMEQYRASLELRRLTGDKAGQAMTLHNIGIEHREMGDLPAAHGFYEQALALDRETENQTGEGRTLLSLGTVQYLLGDLQGAAQLFREAHTLSQKTEDRVNEAQALINLGEVEAAQGDIPEAIRLHRRCLDISSELGNVEIEATAQAALGRTLRLINDLSTAQVALERSLALSEEIGARRLQSEALQEISYTYEAQGNYQAALVAYRRYHEIERAMQSEEAERKARTLSARLEVEQARYETELHRLRTQELARQNETLQAQAARLDQEASHDALTGLANRRVLLPRLLEAFSHARRTGESLSVVLVDVDHFKNVNDTFSHAIGDRVLQQIAKLLESGCHRAGDLAARYGGEEFVLLLPGMSPLLATARCEQIRARIESFDWHTIHPDIERLTVSIGVCGDTTCADAEAMLAIADALLYEAKRGGRNQVRSTALHS